MDFFRFKTITGHLVASRPAVLLSREGSGFTTAFPATHHATMTVAATETIRHVPRHAHDHSSVTLEVKVHTFQILT